jgi:allantoate deiminase
MSAQDGAEVMARLATLAQISDDPPKLTRLFLSDAHRKATTCVSDWMAEAGMAVRIDPIANVIGRYEGHTANAPALVIGSHIDTVRDAGWYDGNLGVILGIEAIRHLSAQNWRAPFAVEVIAFGDEENARFPTSLLGSRAVAGKVAAQELDARDSAGASVSDELRRFGLDPSALATVARKKSDILAYLEVHIEQGPVLDRANLALGVVTAINGATRWRVELVGNAGHAGTVPMDHRRDALAGFAAMCLAIEALAKSEPGLVATVGQVTARPGAANVIPGRVTFSIDCRHSDDAARQRALIALEARLHDIARERALILTIERYYDAPAAPCNPQMQILCAETLARLNQPVFHLASGAGHDAMALAPKWPIGMIFVRCKDGISHNPLESITQADAGLALDALIDFIRHFDPARLVSDPPLR